MLSFMLMLAGIVAAGLTIVAAVFVGGFRAEWPPVVDRVRRMNRTLNQGQLPTSGQPGSFAGVLHHVGRTSGAAYATPVGIEPYGDDFVIAIVYGRRSDWLRNVMAAGSATIDLEGETYAVERPEIVPTADVAEAFGARDRFYQRVLGIDECLLLRRAHPRRDVADDES